MTRSNAFSILCVIVRFFAIWLFVNSVVQLSAFFALPIPANEAKDLREQFLVQQGFLLTFCLILWIFADKVARLALARPQQQVFESDMPMEQWQAIAFSVLGAWEAIEGITYLGQRIIRLAIMHFEQGAPVMGLPDDFYTWMVAEGIRVSIGFALLFGSRGLVGLIRRYRQLGMAEVEPVGPESTAAGGEAGASARPE